MLSEQSHPSDQELLLAVDGELSAPDAGRVQSHLAACWAVPRAQTGNRGIHWRVHPHASAKPGSPDSASRWPARAAEGATGPTCVTSAHALEALVGYRRSRLRTPRDRILCFSLPGAPSVRARGGRNRPNPSLTPGATVLVGRNEVCMGSNTKNKAVPVALQRRVFDEYGIQSAAPAAYEVDYLITPALGGADDIHNLWPQAYTATVWNAQVKDALEDHLRTWCAMDSLIWPPPNTKSQPTGLKPTRSTSIRDQPFARFRQRNGSAYLRTVAAVLGSGAKRPNPAGRNTRPSAGSLRRVDASVRKIGGAPLRHARPQLSNRRARHVHHLEICPSADTS